MVRYFVARVCHWICAGLLLLSAHDLLAQPAGSRTKDEADIHQAGKDYLTAIGRGDSKALADFWTTDGTYTDETGRTVKVMTCFRKAVIRITLAVRDRTASM